MWTIWNYRSNSETAFESRDIDAVADAIADLPEPLCDWALVVLAMSARRRAERARERFEELKSELSCLAGNSDLDARFPRTAKMRGAGPEMFERHLGLLTKRAENALNEWDLYSNLAAALKRRAEDLGLELPGDVRTGKPNPRRVKDVLEYLDRLAASR